MYVFPCHTPHVLRFLFMQIITLRREWQLGPAGAHHKVEAIQDPLPFPTRNSHRQQTSTVLYSDHAFSSLNQGYILLCCPPVKEQVLGECCTQSPFRWSKTAQYFCDLVTTIGCHDTQVYTDDRRMMLADENGCDYTRSAGRGGGGEGGEVGGSDDVCSRRRPGSRASLARFSLMLPKGTVTSQLAAPARQCALKHCGDSHHQQPWLSVKKRCSLPPGGRNSEGVHMIPDCRPGTTCTTSWHAQPPALDPLSCPGRDNQASAIRVRHARFNP